MIEPLTDEQLRDIASRYRDPSPPAKPATPDEVRALLDEVWRLRGTFTWDNQLTSIPPITALRFRPSARDGDVLAVLGAIDRGEIPVRKTDRGTLVDYETADGWRFRIFDDAGEWDYVDAFARPGEDWTPCDPDSHREVFNWTPSDETFGTVWQWFGSPSDPSEEP